MTMKKTILTSLILLAILIVAIKGVNQTAQPTIIETTPTITPTKPTPSPSPSIVSTPNPIPIPTPVPVEPEATDQISRSVAWMEDAYVNQDWLDYNENFGEIVGRLYNQYGFSLEACMGIAANIYYESAYEPQRNAYDGSGSYGLCQWLGERIANLWTWCYENSLDASTVEGQVAFIVHELEFYNINLTGSAYDCGYQFCMEFERPNNIYNQANMRGAHAQELFDMFGDETNAKFKD